MSIQYDRLKNYHVYNPRQMFYSDLNLGYLYNILKKYKITPHQFNEFAYQWSSIIDTIEYIEGQQSHLDYMNTKFIQYVKNSFPRFKSYAEPKLENLNSTRVNMGLVNQAIVDRYTKPRINQYYGSSSNVVKKARISCPHSNLELEQPLYKSFEVFNIPAAREELANIDEADIITPNYHHDFFDGYPD